MKKNIKINFCDWYGGFNKENNLYTNILKQFYDIEISENPDFLFYSLFGLEHEKYECVKIFQNGENVIPNFNECDYGEGPDYIDFGDRYFRHNNYFIDKSICRRNITEDYCNRRFCNFIYSNTTSGEGATLRQQFCQKLMQYKHIDCPGKVLNNMSAEDLEPPNGDWWKSKLEFLKKYKFTIAFENSSSNGYTTEKLVQPLQSFSIPIYYGNPLVTRDFNPKAFINCNDYDNNFDAVIERVKELDNNPDKYLAMLRENPMQPDFDFNQQAKFEQWLINIIEKGNKPFNKDPRDWDKKYYKLKMQDLENENKDKSMECVIYKSLLRDLKRSPCLGRIDFSSKNHSFDVYVNGSGVPEKQANWMREYNKYGYTIEKNDTNVTLMIKALDDVNITLELRGKWELEKDGKLMEHWVDFASLVINGKEILSQTISVWHNRPFIYTMDVKKGDILNLHAEWKQHETEIENN